MLGLHLSRLFELNRVEVVLDVGARFGEYGTWLRQNGFRGWIVSFEPVPESVLHLRERARGDRRWLVRPYALGSANGVAAINVATMSTLSSLLPLTDYGRAEFGEVAATDRVETIQVRRLADVDDLPGGVTYLKMDTQGFDLEVLAGADLSCVVALQTEAAVQVIYDGAPDHVQTMGALARYGFTPSGMFPVSLDEAMRLVEYDLVAVRSP